MTFELIRAQALGEPLERFREIDLPDYPPLTLRFIGDLFHVVREEKQRIEDAKNKGDDDDDDDDAESAGTRNWNELPFDT